MLGLPCCQGFSRAELSEGYSLLHCTSSGVFGLRELCYMGSAVAAPELWHTGSVAEVCRLSCSTACWTFLDQGSNPCLLHWQADFLPLSHQESSIVLLFFNFFHKVVYIVSLINLKPPYSSIDFSTDHDIFNKETAVYW